MKSHTVIKPIVLIADNSATYRHSLRSFLQLNGYRVKEANSVEQAQRKLKRGVVDLALIDLRLTNDKKPTDNSGLDVAKLAMRLGIPRLIITAYPSVEAVRDALSSRGSDSPRASDLVPKRKGSTGVLAAMRKVKSLDHLVVLHISDLHFGAPAGRVPYYQAEALRKIKEDLQALRQEKRIGRINVIVVSGDTSFRCRREGFNQALEFLRRLCRSLKVRHEQVIIIPGNHDIHRQKANKILKSHSMDKRKDNVLFGKFTPFLNFTKRWYGQPVFSRGKLYKIFTVYGRAYTSAENYAKLVSQLKAQIGEPKRTYDDQTFGIRVLHTEWTTETSTLDLRMGAGFMYEVRYDNNAAREKQIMQKLKHSI